MKAGVYYNKKLGPVRQQSFYPKLFVYELIEQEAMCDYKKEPDRACRKFEETFSIWTYYHCTNPKWDTEGIDDSQIHLIDDLGKTEE